YAKNLLTNTNMSILDISMESGFENLSHFYHLFKKNFQVTPAKFRKINNSMYL
ncbi:helix-turn-helix domain-containing protein, partial [Clostridium grantii]